MSFLEAVDSPAGMLLCLSDKPVRVRSFNMIIMRDCELPEAQAITV
jgi:hypothetical protein